MDERLIYASGRTLRRRQLVGVVAVAAVVLGGVYLGFSSFEWGVAVLLVVALVCGLVAVEMRIRRPLPELRLSADGIEGAFGLIEWHDVVGVSLKMRLRLHARGVIVRLRPGAHLLSATREFAEVGNEIQMHYRDRLELETGHLELRPRGLAREIERFRLST